MVYTMFLKKCFFFSVCFLCVYVYSVASGPSLSLLPCCSPRSPPRSRARKRHQPLPAVVKYPYSQDLVAIKIAVIPE